MRLMKDAKHLVAGNIKYNRLFRISQGLVGLANDSTNSYVVFYKDFFTMEEGGNYTINDAIC